MTINVSRQIMIDQAYIELERFVGKLQSSHQLNNAEMELLLYKTIASVNTYKSAEYAKDITTLSYQIQELQKKQADYVVKEE